jgi:hypothetical protein
LKTVGIASGNIPDAEGVRDLIGATLVAGPGLYSIVNDSGDTVTFYRDDRSCVSLEPYYLPQITSSGAAYHSIVSTERLVPTYSGALAQIGGTTDIGTGATGLTAGAVSTLRDGGSALRISTLYDQSGNGRHATQSNSARRPGLHDQVLVNGKPMDPLRRQALRPHRPEPAPGRAGPDAEPEQPVEHPDHAHRPDGEHRGAGVRALRHQPGQEPLHAVGPVARPTRPSTAATFNMAMRARRPRSGSRRRPRPSSSPSATARRAGSLRQRHKYTSATVPASATLTAFKWGYTSGVSLDQFWANFRGMAYITISGNVSDHDIQQITRCLLHRWGRRTTSCRASR